MRERYLALLRVTRQNLLLEKEKKKATDALFMYDSEIKEERDQQMYEQRATIGRQLHDNLSSSLISLKYYVSDRLAMASSEGERKTLAEIKNEVVSIYGETRNYSHQLIKNDDSTEIHDIGDYLTKLKQRFNDLGLVTINISFDSNYVKNELCNATKNAAYFFIKECLSNILKHANASQTSIKIAFDDHHNIINVQDNGTGFNNDKTTQGVGFINLKHRLTQVNGKLEIKSNLGKTDITALIPRSLNC